MTYKTLSLSEEAYELLKKEKQEGESFGDTIIRLINSPNMEKIMSFFGSMEEELAGENINEFIREAKKAWR